MARRIARLTPRLVRRLQALPREVRADVGATIRGLQSGDLPSLFDASCIVPPVGGTRWVRRVRGRNLWLWFTFTETEVTVTHVTDSPPVPVD